MTERSIGYQLKHSKEINQTLYNDSEKSLWNFANTPLGEYELKTWKARFQSLVISRLNNTHNTNSYFQSISMTINSLQKPENKDEEMIALSFKESLIDGIGFYCASEYGTSDIAHDQDRKKSKQDISTAFSTTMEIVKTIIREEAHDEESQSPEFPN